MQLLPMLAKLTESAPAEKLAQMPPAIVLTVIIAVVLAFCPTERREAVRTTDDSGSSNAESEFERHADVDSGE